MNFNPQQTAPAWYVISWIEDINLQLSTYLVNEIRFGWCIIWADVRQTESLMDYDVIPIMFQAKSSV